MKDEIIVHGKLQLDIVREKDLYELAACVGIDRISGNRDGEIAEDLRSSAVQRRSSQNSGALDGAARELVETADSPYGPVLGFFAKFVLEIVDIIPNQTFFGNVVFHVVGEFFEFRACEIDLAVNNELLVHGTEEL